MNRKKVQVSVKNPMYPPSPSTAAPLDTVVSIESTSTQSDPGGNAKASTSPNAVSTVMGAESGSRSTHRPPQWIQSASASSAAKEDQSQSSISSSTMNGTRPTLFLSLDVETNGPVPGLFSMLSIGLAGFTTGKQLVWEREINLHPLPDAQEDAVTMDWWRQPEQAEAWARVQVNAQDPAVVLKQLASDLQELRDQYRVFVVAWPACFDWMFFQWYMYRFVGDNPLGRRAKCMDTYAWALSKTSNPNVTISQLVDSWKDEEYQHTHVAIDDAKEQGAKFINMLRENTRHGRDRRLCHRPGHAGHKKNKK